LPFSQLGLSPESVKAVRAMGFKEPTAVQAKTIPLVLQRRDVIAGSQTGTGKTAAFVLPIMELARRKEIRAEGGRPVALVLAPTRELCAQGETMARDLGRFSKMRVTAVYGGVPIPPQQKALKEGADLVFATPGRLLDLASRRDVDLSQVGILVLDEADRLLDMGFLPDLTRILKLLPSKRQNLLFSATLPPDVQNLADHVLKDPAKVEIGIQRAPAEGVRQIVYPVMPIQKLSLLVELMGRHGMDSVLIFARTKHGADKVAARLGRENHAVARLHSNRTQQQRESALTGFRKGRYDVLVATDVASRGLDIEGISHVINYDVPQYAEDYVHRVGRTARGTAVGDAITLVTPDERRSLTSIEQFIGYPVPQAMIIGFDYEPLPIEKSDGVRLADFAKGARMRKRPSRRTGRQQWGARK
jgi:ATP-dependent RNA helicase RhlE